MVRTLILLTLVELGVFSLAQGKPERLSMDMKQQIVNFHNELRRKETASNMRLMEWNNELEDIAYRFIDHCMTPTDSFDREVMLRSFRTSGENIFFVGTNESVENDLSHYLSETWDEELQEEKESFIYKAGRCKNNSLDCYRYAQVVWSKSCAVGCAMRREDSSEDCPDKSYNGWFFLRCVYGPAGVVPKSTKKVKKFTIHRPFLNGTACSACNDTGSKYAISGWDTCVCGLCSQTALPFGHCNPRVFSGSTILELSPLCAGFLIVLCILLSIK